MNPFRRRPTFVETLLSIALGMLGAYSAQQKEGEQRREQDRLRESVSL